MNEYNMQGYIYEDMMPLNDISFVPSVSMPNVNTAGNNLENSISNNTTTNNNMNLVSPQVGFNRGNLFANLYNQYKNFQPVQLVGRTEQERLYINLSQLAFAAHELNLYLDNFPNDQTMLKLFNDYRNMANTAKEEYESKYGPISINSDVLSKSPWMWVSPFPWDEGGM